MLIPNSIAILTAVFFTSVTPSISSSSRNGRKLFKPHFEFAIDMYREISSDFPNKNLVFSPYVLNSELAMLFLGTSSFTTSSKQLRQVMHLSNISYVDVHKSFKAIVHNFDDSYYQSMLNMGSGFFLQNVTSVSRPYIGALHEIYRVKVNHLDSESSECGPLRATVSNWMRSVEKNGVNGGDSLVNTMRCDSKLLVVGTTHLSNQLLQPFRIADTFQEGLFFLPNNKRLDESI